MERFEKWFDNLLVVSLGLLLILHYTNFSSVLNDSVLAILAIIGTLPVVVSSLRALKNRKISIDLLASIALIASMLAGEWSSAVFINLMLASARIFGRYTDGQARRAIQSLLKLRPERVKIKKPEGITEVSIEDIRLGDLVVVGAGDRVPVDGTIMTGTASIDQSSLTGESIPVSKKEGDQVLSSTLNVSGTLEVKAEKIGADTTLSKIIKLVESSQNEKPGIHTLADRFTTLYIVLTFAGAIIAYLISHDLNFVLALLLVACADDIAVALPLGFMAAIGAAAKEGIIIKGGNYLEGLAKIKVLLMDKTGTLTSGRLAVEGVTAFGGISETLLVEYATSVECFSDHPAAKAIVEYASNQKIFCNQPEGFNEIPGKGSTATYQSKELVAGKLSFFKDKNIPVSDEELAEINKAKNRGLNTTLIGYDGKIVGFLSLADKLRPETVQAVKELKELGVSKLIMLTGDNEAVARKIATETGITEYHANLLPENKLDYIRKELNKKTKIGMVGDGVNDAAALALADVGIAMGAIGSDAAIEAADVALMRDDLTRIPAAIRLGRFTMQVAYQDFVIWGVVNLIGFGLVLAHIIGPQGAAAFNFVTDFFPFMNSLRLFRLGKIDLKKN